MDVYEIRKLNLLSLLAGAERTSLKAIGEAMVQIVQQRGLDRAPDYPNVLSQHKGKKRIGAQMARLIEEAVGKPRGWMDALQTVDIAMEAREAAQVYMNMVPEQRDAWLSMGRALAAKDAKAGPGLPFGDIPPGGKKNNK
jgi:hypothetical protein